MHTILCDELWNKISHSNEKSVESKYQNPWMVSRICLTFTMYNCFWILVCIYAIFKWIAFDGWPTSKSKTSKTYNIESAHQVMIYASDYWLNDARCIQWILLTFCYFYRLFRIVRIVNGVCHHNHFGIVLYIFIRYNCRVQCTLYIDHNFIFIFILVCFICLTFHLIIIIYA